MDACRLRPTVTLRVRRAAARCVGGACSGNLPRSCAPCARARSLALTGRASLQFSGLWSDTNGRFLGADGPMPVCPAGESAAPAAGIRAGSGAPLQGETGSGVADYVVGPCTYVRMHPASRVLRSLRLPAAADDCPHLRRARRSGMRRLAPPSGRRWLHASSLRPRCGPVLPAIRHWPVRRPELGTRLFRHHLSALHR